MTEAIDPIHYKSSYRLAAERIRRAIELGTYLPGERLPPSREFALQLGISVATLREAVRGLIDEGLLEMRRGPKGGLVVLPQPKGRRRGRVTKAALSEINQLIELRQAVEGEAARLAAERRTDADLKRLQDSLDTMTRLIEEPEDGRRPARFTRADTHFHTDIARAGANELLVPVIEDARLRLVTAMGFAFSELTPDANEGHDTILREIRRQRPEAAAKAARRHVEKTRQSAIEVVSK